MAFDVSSSGSKNISLNDSKWEEARRYIFCDICQTAEETIPELKKEIVASSYFPGSEGCTSLNAHLRAYFVVRKLLKLPGEEVFQLISHDEEKSVTSVGHRPFTTEFCQKCEIIVDEAVGLYNKILDLEGQIDMLGEKLMEFRKSKDCPIIVPDEHPPENTKFGTTEKRKRSTRNPSRFCEDEDSDSIPEHDRKSTKVKRRNNKIVVTPYSDNDDSDYIPDEPQEAEASDEDWVMERNFGNIEDLEAEKEITATGDKAKETNEHETPVITSRIPNSGDGNKMTTPKFRFQCTECSKVFSLRNCLHHHTRRVHGFEMMYPCPQCPDLKFSRSGLKKHRIEVHDVIHKCSKCGKKLSCRRTLDQHLNLVHKMKITYPCSFCTKVFKKKYDLTVHKNKDHVIPSEILYKLPEREPQTEEERIFAENPCQYCGKVFLSGKPFLSHLEKHERALDKKERSIENKMRCFFCWKLFLLEQSRWVHTQMDHRDIPLEFPCEICTEEKIKFQSTSELYLHYETVHQKGDVPIHQCTKCGWPFYLEESLNTHQEFHVHRVPVTDPDAPEPKKAHYSSKSWFCWEIFPTEEALRRHLTKSRRHKGLKIEFPCDLETCSHHTQPFQKVGELNTHLVKCHGDSHAIHQCSVCSWGFYSKDMHDLHRLNHVHRRYSLYKCTACERSFRKLWSLKDHFNLTHGSSVELYKCSYCPMKYSNTRAISKHTTAMHEEEILEGPASATAMPCDQCGKVFKNMKYVKMHKLQKHMPIICPDCKLEFPTRHQLTLHRKKLHRKPGTAPEEQHLCTHCGKTFEDKTALKKHNLIHGEKKFECHICGYKTWTISILRVHVQNHEDRAKKDPPPPPKFPCNLCEKGYARKDSLEDHVRVHHTSITKRVHICPKCGKRFTRKGYLEAHVGSNGCSERFGPDLF